MMGYGPASFHDHFSDDDLLSEGSSVGDVSSPICPALREYAMADMLRRQPVLVETEDTHTPPDLWRGLTPAAATPAAACIDAPPTQL
jgi:hypothetical protein